MELEDCDEDLLAHLRGIGATDEELREAVEAGRAGALSLELTLRPTGATSSFDEAAAALGLPPGDAAQVWRALGFVDPANDPTLRLAPDEVQALSLLAADAAELIGLDSVLALSRGVGAATSKLAEALTDTFRTEFEHPRRTAGTPYADVVKEYSRVATALLPSFVELFGTVLRRHLVAVAASSWELDESPTTRRSLVVGFCDLVDYTALSGRATPGELASLIVRFEQLAGEAAGAHRGRVVKLIGDAAMFVCDDPADGLAIALDLLDALEADGGLPTARAALASGMVVTLHGDHYGSVVNLAARLLATAEPGTVVVADELRAAADADAALVATALPPRALKGFDDPQPAHVVRRTS